MINKKRLGILILMLAVVMLTALPGAAFAVNQAQAPVPAQVLDESAAPVADLLPQTDQVETTSAVRGSAPPVTDVYIYGIESNCIIKPLPYF